MTIPADLAVAAARAVVVHPAHLPRSFGISTDTRTLEPGDAFVALRGERFDGHAFVAEARHRGAAVVVVSDAAAVPPDVPALVVADTTAAYLAFAGVARERLRARIVAITGSTGKTTTKALLEQLLRAAGDGDVEATPANENNELGVAKLLLGAPSTAAFVVVEIGARHAGEIAPLARLVRPDVAVLTNVGDAHLEIMGSPERLAATKWGVFASGAQAVLNLDDAVSRERAPSLDAQPEWFAARDERVAGSPPRSRETFVVGRSHLVVREPEDERAYAVDVRLPGDHNRANVAAAAAAALALGVNAAAIAAASSALVLPAGRYERSRAGDVDIVYDAYNASMSGTLATLQSFSREPNARRIAVLGSMAELGADAPEMHARVGAAAAAGGLAALLVGGDFGSDLARGALANGFDPAHLVRFADNDDALAWLRANARAGDLVLLKASRKYRLEEIRDGLAAERA